MTTGKDIDPQGINHPKHYNVHPSGVECIDVVEHMGFNLGNAIKYIWRADEKEDSFKDLRKAVWYIEREIERRTKQSNPETSDGAQDFDDEARAVNRN